MPFSSLFLMALGLLGSSECFGHDRSGVKKLGVDPGPAVIATRGEVWPKPRSKITNDLFFIIRPNNFRFKVVGNTCDILEKALQRYKQDLKSQERIRRMTKMLSANETQNLMSVKDETFKGYLDEVSVDLRSPCEQLPYLDMDEHYELKINTNDFPEKAVLMSQSVWGILRGLESWSHLVYVSSDSNALLVNSTSIMDFPRFSHRGLLIDTSRHYLPTKIIYSMLDGMAMSKLNVLHWHIVDDQSFPYQSTTFPELSAKGAYSATHVYAPADVASIIRYAASRGIRVVPEFDTPGHTRSWGQAHPELLTVCYRDTTPDGSLGPVNPIRHATYDFVKELLKEIKDAFPDDFIHLGGDEVEVKCWESNPEVQKFMEEKNMTARELEGSYIKTIIEFATSLLQKTIVWQEVFDDGVQLPKETLIQIWKSNYVSELYEVTKKGYAALLSSCWYLDNLSSGGDWKKFYGCDPLRFPGSEKQKKLVLGGEACMWGEVVDATNVMSRVWPRACAAAEKLWSSPGGSLGEAAERLEEHACRMNRRKIAAQPPNGPGFCPGLNFS